MASFDFIVCGGEAFGPWLPQGAFSFCFVDAVLYPVLGFMMLLVVLVRWYQVSLDFGNKEPVVPGMGLRMALCCVLSSISLLILLVRYLLSTLVVANIIRLTILSLAWFFAVVVLSMEAAKNLNSNFLLQIWFIAAFTVSVIRLQGYIVLSVGFTWDLPFMILEMLLSLLVAGMAWLVNGDPDIIKENEASKKRGVEVGKDGNIQGGENTPLLLEKEEKVDGGAVAGKRFPISPEESANPISKMLYIWTNSLYKLGASQALELDDLWPLIDEDKGEVITREFEEEWAKEQAKPDVEQRSLHKAVWRTFGKEFCIGGLYKLINDTLVFAGPLILNLLIQYMSTPSWPLWYGVLFAAGLFVASCIQSFAVNTYFFRVYRVGQRARSAMVSIVYKKAFNISNAGRQDYTTGEITNFMSVDATRLQNLTPYLHMVWSAPLQIIVSISLLYQQIGPSVFAGLGFMLVMIPVNVFLVKRLSTYQRAMMINKDRRLKIMNEILSGMRIIKFFAWEDSYINAANRVRREEVNTLKSSSYLRATTVFSWMVTPVFVSLFSFLSFTLSGNELTASIAFTSVALFNVLRFPLNMLPNVISNCVDANISLGRIKKYLVTEDRDRTVIDWNQAGNPRNPIGLGMDNASFSWSVGGKDVLRQLTFQVPKGKLVALVGAVGCGKSSVLSAFLGEMELTGGRAYMDGTLAYASQQAWIQNASLRDNVLFGLPMNLERYSRTVDACQLRADLGMLPAGDDTEIGEKGINLSGGQKQRVSLARAVYADKDIYLLDDVLSAVDVHVGRAIFDNVLRGLLVGKTVLVVTHQLQYLPMFDNIILLNGGAIAEQGTYAELMQQNGKFATLIREHAFGGEEAVEEVALLEEGPSSAADQFREHAKAALQVVEAAKEKEKDVLQPSPSMVSLSKQADEKKKKIMSQEEREVGRLRGKVIGDYIFACGGALLFAVVLCVLLIEASSNVATNVWLSQWSGDPGLLEHPLAFWLGLYCALGCIAAAATWIRALTVARAGVRASYMLHDALLRRIMRAPTSFFDSTPIGRILNRFSGDVYTVDEQLPFTLGMLASMLLACCATLGVISYTTPLFLAFLFPLAYIYRSAQQYYIASSRELKRLDSISRSPIYTHFTESIDGATTIRSYGMEDRFVETNLVRLDTNQTAYFCYQTSNRWLAIRLEFIGTIVVFLSSLFAVFSRGALSGGLVGMSISYALQMTGTLNWLVRQSTEAEVQLVAVERITQYSQVPQEPPAELPGRDPPSQWPQSGGVTFNNFSLRYREGLDLVLKNITINVKPREKVGIVGRTGAGKSSMVLALFRFVEAAGGSISIDGVDISTIGTDRLRRCITIIPQDPVLFVGTVRHNLDPFHDHSDDEVWHALERVHLRQEIEAKGGLEFQVAEGGENFSVGQRQLFCMARALLRPAKVLVMDEATSNVDAESDALIQKTIRQAFADRTVFTIAHRINTIVDSDKILVLSKGSVVEFDSPQTLLANKDSVFYGMMAEATQQEKESKKKAKK